ncbi:hypothetical protein ONE63_003456 [Megalurothrips usitatus]|uniref:Uncharacterized protein n=1 Tax=Megalurothrips usitatus TaxID=439358 RepID=A0AAV7XB20_9NEOP|nr:hypothetical protein ONE63_003456 [Megalurothrips usitatus]
MNALWAIAHAEALEAGASPEAASAAGDAAVSGDVEVSISGAPLNPVDKVVPTESEEPEVTIIGEVIRTRDSTDSEDPSNAGVNAGEASSSSSDSTAGDRHSYAATKKGTLAGHIRRTMEACSSNPENSPYHLCNDSWCIPCRTHDGTGVSEDCEPPQKRKRATLLEEEEEFIKMLPEDVKRQLLRLPALASIEIFDGPPLPMLTKPSSPTATDSFVDASSNSSTESSTPEHDSVGELKSDILGFLSTADGHPAPRQARPDWVGKLWDARRSGEEPQKCRYSSMMGVRYPINPSSTKFIVMGLDFERQLVPFVSIENTVGQGVYLSVGELKELVEGKWCSDVMEHMKAPSYKVNTHYTTRHEFRCTMLRGKPCVQITPLKGLGGFICIGEASWTGLKSLESVVRKYTYELMELSLRLPGDLKVYLERLESIREQLNFKTVEDIKNRMSLIYELFIMSAGSFTEERLKHEFVALYPDMITRMIFQVMTSGIQDTP